MVDSALPSLPGILHESPERNHRDRAGVHRSRPGAVRTIRGAVTPLRILSANLRHDGADPVALLETLDALDVDVLCVQELGPRLADAIGRALPEGALGPDPTGQGLGIACRRPAEVRRLPLSGRDGWAARLSPAHWSELLQPVEICNVHIFAPQMWPYFPRAHTRGRQVDGLLAFLDESKPLPRAVVGDFNSTPIWPAYRRIAARLRQSVTAHRSGAFARHRTWPHVPALGIAGWIGIDHCFLTGLVARDLQVVPLRGSDHLGLCIDVAAPEASGRTTSG
jgi:endonuclease/exonuclease/phosphatase (EEP) superfamily protein YafD